MHLRDGGLVTTILVELDRAWQPPCWGEREQDQCGQATKGVWGMSWRQKAMKGVENCDKPGEAVKRALIPGFPNDRMLNP